MKHTIHLHAHFNGQGKFTSWFPYDTKLSCTPGDTGFFVWVSEHEVEIPTPDSWEVAGRRPFAQLPMLKRKSVPGCKTLSHNSPS